ncbi:MAG TPA: LLM class flavin-dependent oxidoreductase [Marmoricola sp.]|jgi:probable F420-dependent oxidoreductase|nr:LLM class flavin-dependent oxidoreductase [Marmoricola sp.]
MRISYQPWGETLAELADAGRRAEEAGAEVLWCSELHRSATGTAAALIAGTSTARIGTSIMLAFVRSPMTVALEALDLDELSGGRFTLGLGSGVARLNESWHNVPFGKPVPHLRETVRNIRAFWEGCRSGEPIAFEGEYEPMSIRGYERPFPVARTDVPLYLAAMGPLMTRLAGEVADGWISHELCSPQYLRERIYPDLDAGLAKGGRSRDQLDTVVSACCSISEDLTLARRRVAGLVGFYASVRTYLDFFEFHDLAADQQKVIEAFRSGAGADYLADEVSDRMVDELTLVGDRDTVLERIASYDGLADDLKLSPPTHGLAVADTRAAQNEIIAMMSELTGARA